MKIWSVNTLPIIVGTGAAITLALTGVDFLAILTTGALTPFPLWQYLLLNLTLLGFGAGIFRLIMGPRVRTTAEISVKQLASSIKELRENREFLPGIPVLTAMFGGMVILFLVMYAFTVFVFRLILGPVQTAFIMALIVASVTSFTRNNPNSREAAAVYAALYTDGSNPFFNTILEITNFSLTVTQFYLWNAVYLSQGMVAMLALSLATCSIVFLPMIVEVLKFETEG